MYIDGDTHYWPVRFLDRVKHSGRGHIEFQNGAGEMIRYGEKFPGDAISTWPKTMAPIKAMSDISEEDKEKILGGNAMRLFGMKA